MSLPLQPKCKQCRRAGEKLFLKGEKCMSVKCPIIKRNYAPGMHGPGQGQRKRISEYGLQLKEKQKAKAMYRLGEKQFLNYYKNALRASANTGAELLQQLERRLDNTVFRLGLAISRDQARQLVSHGHIQVNGRRIDVPSHQVRKGDVMTLRKSSSELIQVKESIAKREAERPDWLSFEPGELSGTVVALPEATQEVVGVDPKLIIEYYSR